MAESTQRFTAEQAYAAAQHDVEIAHAAADYVSKLDGGPLTAEQRREIVALIVQMRYESHIREGRLQQRSIARSYSYGTMDVGYNPGPPADNVRSVPVHVPPIPEVPR